MIDARRKRHDTIIHCAYETTDSQLSLAVKANRKITNKTEQNPETGSLLQHIDTLVPHGARLYQRSCVRACELMNGT